MIEQTHYQVLGVRPEASHSAIEAAYQRLLRQYQTAAALERRRIGHDLMVNAARIDRIEEAYFVLRDPVRRQSYDETLIARGKGEESMDLARTARQYSAEAGAWLAEQRRDEETVTFRIGWAVDYAAIRASLEDQIPAGARHFDAARGEWRIDLQYEDVLVDLFDNYDVPHRLAPARLAAPTYQPQPYVPVKRQVREVWEGWPYLIIDVLAVAIVLALLFPPPNERQIAANATATAVAIYILSQQTGPGSFPTPTPTLTPPPSLVSAMPSFASVHLRAGPSIDSPSLGFLASDQTYAVIGRTVDHGWLVIVTPEQVGWSAAWTLTIEGDLSILPIYTADSDLPELTVTATPESPPG